MIRDSLCNIVEAALQRFSTLPRTEDTRAELEARLRIDVDTVNGVADTGVQVRMVYDEANRPVFTGKVSYRADVGESGSQIINFFLAEDKYVVYR